MVANSSLGVQEASEIPPSYKRRVKIEGRATLVIENINPGDNTEFKCDLFGGFSQSVSSGVKLIVAGMYHRHNH